MFSDPFEPVPSSRKQVTWLSKRTARQSNRNDLSHDGPVDGIDSRGFAGEPDDDSAISPTSCVPGFDSVIPILNTPRPDQDSDGGPTPERCYSLDTETINSPESLVSSDFSIILEELMPIILDAEPSLPCATEVTDQRDAAG